MRRTDTSIGEIPSQPFSVGLTRFRETVRNPNLPEEEALLNLDLMAFL
jgi:hypothetical protein